MAPVASFTNSVEYVAVAGMCAAFCADTADVGGIVQSPRSVCLPDVHQFTELAETVEHAAVMFWRRAACRMNGSVHLYATVSGTDVGHAFEELMTSSCSTGISAIQSVNLAGGAVADKACLAIWKQRSKPTVTTV